MHWNILTKFYWREFNHKNTAKRWSYTKTMSPEDLYEIYETYLQTVITLSSGRYWKILINHGVQIFGYGWTEKLSILKWVDLTLQWVNKYQHQRWCNLLIRVAFCLLCVLFHLRNHFHFSHLCTWVKVEAKNVENKQTGVAYTHFKHKMAF